jgi:hypothetical protein
MAGMVQDAVAADKGKNFGDWGRRKLKKIWKK